MRNEFGCGKAAGAATMATINWTAGSGNWNNASDWNGGVPADTDTVQIDVSSITVTISTAGDTAYSLSTSGATLSVTGGSLYTVSSANFGGAYLQSGGTYIAGGSGANFDSTIATLGGTMEALAGSTLNIADGGTLAGTVTGTGVLDFSGGTTYLNAGFSSTISSIEVGNAALGFNTNFSTANYFAELGSGTVDFFGHKITLSGAALLEGVVGNGTLIQSGTLTLGGNGSGASLENGLTLDVNGTTIQSNNLSVGSNDSGAKIAISKKGLYVINGNWAITDGSSIGTITNAGTFEKTGGGRIAAIDVSFTSTGTIKTQTGTILLDGLTNAVSGSVSGAGTLGIAGGITTLGKKLSLTMASLNQQSGVLVLNNALSYTGEWDQSGGVLNLNSTASTLTLSGPTNFDGGTISGYGGTLLLDGPTQLGGVTIGGPNTLTVKGTLDQTSSIAFGQSSNPFIDILSGATWTIEGDSSISGQTGLIENQGSFIDSNGSGTATIQTEFESTGTVTVNNATLRFSGPTILDGIAGGSGLLDLAGNTTLQSGLAITVAELDINGALGLSGNISYANGFSQAGGTIALNGNTLALTGSASFDGGQLSAGGDLTTTGPTTLFGYNLTNGSILEIKGSAEQTSDLNINAATLQIDAGGVYTVDNDNFINTFGGGTVTIAGELVASGTGTSNIAAVVTLTGKLEVDDRVLSLSGGGSLGGTIAGSGTLALLGGDFTAQKNLAATVSALQLEGGATLDLAANETYAGYFDASGTIALGTGTTLSLTGTTLLNGAIISGPGTLLASGDTTLSATAIVSGATLDIAKTAEQGPNDVTVGASATLLIAAGGTYTLDAGQTIDGAGVLDVAGALNTNEDANTFIDTNIVDAGHISNSLGTLQVSGAVSGGGNFVIGAAGTLQFAQGSVITASNTVSFGAATSALLLQDEARQTDTFNAVLANFSAGNTIELYDFIASTTTITQVSGNVFTISDTSDDSITLTFSAAIALPSLFIGSTADGRTLLEHH